jgi:acetylornithine deacetylase/succinyl-diaminopimelate desuccinylase-like protein
MHEPAKVFGWCAPLMLCSALGNADEASNALARDLFQELIQINTTASVGNVTIASQAMAARLIAAGFAPQDVQVLGPSERKQNLVARFRGRGRHKPVLLMGHLDVVEARREDWTTDPFAFIEKDGYFYGRGTQDMKDGDAIMVAALIRLKREGFLPSRDIILALTADEEGGAANGIDWLLSHHRALIDAQFAINHDGSSVPTVDGKPLFYEMDSSEKVYGDYQLLATNPGGHSSLPVADNAIYELIAAVTRIQRYEFPFELNAVTRGYYAAMAKIETGARAMDMRAVIQDPPDLAAAQRLSAERVDHSIMHTTCVATRLDAGHANNALPQRAAAVINCRILPGHSNEEVRRTLIDVIGDPKVSVRYIADDGSIAETAPDRRGYPPEVLDPEVMGPLKGVVKQFFGDIQIVPAMSVSASDDIYTNAAGLPTYSITGIAMDRKDHRAHGRDERLSTAAFYRGNDFFYTYLKTMSAR